MTGLMMDSSEDESPRQFGEFSCAVQQPLRDIFPDAVYEKFSRRQADPECDPPRVRLTRVCLRSPRICPRRRTQRQAHWQRRQSIPRHFIVQFRDVQHRVFMIVVGDTTLPRGIREHIPRKLTACARHTRARVLGMDWLLVKHRGRVTTIIACTVAIALTALRIEKWLNE